VVIDGGVGRSDKRKTQLRIKWTSDSALAAIQNMRINHGRPDNPCHIPDRDPVGAAASPGSNELARVHIAARDNELWKF
jgi:hypothetical protein